MKKNKIYTIVIAALLVMCTVSCDDLLEEKPKAQFKLSDLDAELLDKMTIGAYEPMTRSRGRLWESMIGLGLELMGEYADGGTSSANGIVLANWSTYKFDQIRDGIGSSWTTFYKAIGNANQLIANLDADKNLNEVQKNKAYGEARFIRAICYYTMVRLWGPIPLRLKPISNSNDTAMPLAEVQDIYTQIISDLTFAEQVLPVTVTAAQAGRATQGAAKLALADVYLTLQDYTQARQKSKEIIDGKATYGYELVTSLDALYSPTLPTNSEDVFSLKFSQVIGQGSFLTAYYHDDRAKAAGLAARGLRFGGALKRAPLIKDWDKKDLRRNFNLYDTVVINGKKEKANLTSMDYFFGKYKDGSAPEETAAGNDFYLYRYADALLIFAEADNKLSTIPTPAAYDAVNKIRRRGYGVDINTPNPTIDLPAGLSKQEFDDLVFRERGYEFMLESKRYFDLQRTGRIDQYVAAAGKPIPTTRYMPLPNVELQNNPLANK